MAEERPDKHTHPHHVASPHLAEQIVELSALTGGLAHEIRNPLSTLKVNLQLLDEDWRKVEAPTADQPCDPQDVARRSRARIATLLKEANRLEQILYDFLKYIGKRDLRLAAHDLNLVAAELVEFYRPQAHAGGVELEMIPADAPVVCRVDADHIKQAVLNLLINAQQAMPGGGKIQIRISQDSSGAGQLVISDSGPGFDVGQRDRLFEAYYSTKKGGTGLGLATARRIIRQHGGTISAASPVGGGAEFTITLPQDCRE